VLKLFYFILLLRQQPLRQCYKILLAAFPIVRNGDAEVVEPVFVQQFSVLFNHAEK